MYHDNRHCQIRKQRGESSKSIEECIITKNEIEYKTDIRRYNLIDKDLDDNDIEIAEILLISPKSSGKIKQCILVKITKGNETADLIDLNTKFNCTDHYENPSKAGEVFESSSFSTKSIFLKCILEYLTVHKDDLGISRVELADMSKKLIKFDYDQYAIELEQSRQLEGKYPYYMSFGFIPVYTSALIKLQENKGIMNDLYTEYLNIIGYHKDLKEYVENHKNQLMKETIKYIRDNYQLIYITSYKRLFEVFNLKKLEDDEIRYYKIL